MHIFRAGPPAGPCYKETSGRRCAAGLWVWGRKGSFVLKKIVINGGRPLYGEITIGGAKNAAVAIIPAAILVDGVCRIDNLPMISDVKVQLEILKEMGAGVRLVSRNCVELDCRNLRPENAPEELMRRIRASYYILGALLSRDGKAVCALPGGCNFGGVRPIDQHIKGFEALGATVDIGLNGTITVRAENGVKGAEIYLDVVSVGATVNVMLAATLAEGQTIIENAAKEPHVVDLANFLNSMGAEIRGAGTDVIKIRGVKRLSGGFYSIIPDQIEAGTYLAAAAAAGGSVLVKNVIPKHLDCITAKLSEMGCEIEELDDAVRITRVGRLQKTNIKTLPYPGFPTDMQPQVGALLSLAEGTSIITEGVWDSRYRYMDELRRMGGQSQVNGKVCVVEGVSHLQGAEVTAWDLRAGAAMVVAGLAAQGETVINQMNYIERGYEDLVGKLQAVGADIRVEEFPEN